MKAHARHSNGSVKTSAGFIALFAGGMSVGLGVPLGICSLIELFRYSPYEDPGALNMGFWMGIAAAILIGVPVAAALFLGLRLVMRQYLAWRRTLTPEQRFAVDIAETAAMEAVHLRWKEHNRRKSAELTDSVMGNEKREW